MPAMLPRFFRGLLPILALCGTAHGAEAAPPSPIEFLYGGREIFPSIIVSLAENSPYLPRDKTQEGDPTGVIAVRVTAPIANARVRVTLAETPLFAESAVSVILPTAGKEVFVAPIIRWHYERLARIKQPIANLVIKMTVELAGQTEEHYAKVVVHSINDWLQRYKLRGQEDWNVSGRAHFLAAAYVNENNPNIDRVITREAGNFVPLLTGYTGEDQKLKIKAAVDRKELAAIYQSLRSLKFRYTATTQASYISEPDEKLSRVRAQNLRTVNDALEARQATGLESATVLASAYVKLGLHVVIMLVANLNENRVQALLGVFEKRPFRGQAPDVADLLVIDTSVATTKSWEQALEAGQKLFAENRNRLEPLPPGATSGAIARRHTEEHKGNLWIDLWQARADGVLPIPEFEK